MLHPCRTACQGGICCSQQEQTFSLSILLHTRPSSSTCEPIRSTRQPKSGLSKGFLHSGSGFCCCCCCWLVNVCRWTFGVSRGCLSELAGVKNSPVALTQSITHCASILLTHSTHSFSLQSTSRSLCIPCRPASASSPPDSGPDSLVRWRDGGPLREKEGKKKKVCSRLPLADATDAGVEGRGKSLMQGPKMERHHDRRLHPRTKYRWLLCSSVIAFFLINFIVILFIQFPFILFEPNRPLLAGYPTHGR